jgi:hypothetical protein
MSLLPTTMMDAIEETSSVDDSISVHTLDTENQSITQCDKMGLMNYVCWIADKHLT